MDVSDNPMVGGMTRATPENQQERLKTIGWIVGFVDGEGCFSCPIYECKKMTLRWQVRPEFAVVQGASSRDVLEDLVQFFGCGRVFRNRRHDNHREDLFRYCVQRFGDLRTMIVPFFRENPLRTSKQENFDKFARIIELMELRRHLTVPGTIEIAEIAQTMKPTTVQGLENPQRPYASPLLVKRKRWSGPCGDAGRSTEMIDPPTREGVGRQVTAFQRNSLSGKFRPARMA
jgi:hypothetical protein